MRALVVGSDGLVGAALYERLLSCNFRVMGTTRRLENLGTGKIFCDLASGPRLGLAGYDVAVICAAVASGAECEREPERTRQINVTGTLKLAMELFRRGCRVIYCSSDKVFDGSRPRQEAEALRRPQGEYGWQKGRVEEAILTEGGTVVRSSKIVSSRTMPLFNLWWSAWRNKKPVEVFGDLLFAPVSLKQLLDLLEAVIVSEGRGIYQLSASDDISYYQAAQIALADLGLPSSLAQKSALPGDLAAFFRPNAFSSLDTSRIEAEFGFFPCPAAEAVSAFFRTETAD